MAEARHTNTHMGTDGQRMEKHQGPTRRTPLPARLAAHTFPASLLSPRALLGPAAVVVMGERKNANLLNGDGPPTSNRVRLTLWGLPLDVGAFPRLEEKERHASVSTPQQEAGPGGGGPEKPTHPTYPPRQPS